MSKLVSVTNFFAATASNTTAASLTSLGDHATDDDIFICVGHDGAGTGAITMTTGTGWTEVVTQAASDDVRSTVFRKRVTAPETVPVFSANGATSEEWSGTVFVVRGLHATTPVSHWHRVDVSNTNSWNSNGGVAGSTLAASSIAGPTAATYTDGQIVVLYAHADQPQPLSPDVGVLTEIGKSKDAATIAHIVGFKTLNGTGTVPNVVIRGNIAGATEGGVCYALVLNPATASDTLGCASATVTVVAYLGDIGTIHDQAITWGAANDRDATNGGTILSIPTGPTAITPTTSTGPENTSSPWGAFTTWATAANLSAVTYPNGAWTGGIGTLTNPVNISGKMLTFQMSTSYLANATPTGAQGLGIYLEDNASHWSFFQLRKSSTMPYSGELFTPMFDPTDALRSDGSGTLDRTNIKYIGFMAHRQAGSASSRAFSVKSILGVGKTTLFGGGTTDPTTWDAAVRCLTSWSMIGPAVRHVASTDQFQIKQNSDIGDGTNAVVFSSAATSMAFPSAWDGTVASLSDYKATVGPGGKNITLVGGTGSALVLDGSLISADSDTAVEFTVHASYAGTVSANGCTLSGYTFADNKGLSWDGLTIQNGGTATLAAGADFTNCTVQKTTSTNSALAITGNGSVLTGSTTKVADTTVSTNYHLELGTSVTDLELVNHTFTGSAATNKVHVLRTTGTVVITISGTTVLDSGSVTSAGAAISVVAPTVTADISITGMSNTVGANNRLQIINSTAVSAASRANSTAYVAGDIRLRQTGIGSESTAGLYLRCTTSGTSAGSPPTWNTTPGGTTTDGTVVWTTYKVLYYDADPAATFLTDTYIDGEEFKSGEVVEIRFAEEDPAVTFKTYSTSVVAATTGFSALVNETEDDVYATYALSGVAYETTFSPNYTSNYIVLDTNTNFSGASAFAYYCYLLTSSDGMYRFWNGLTALDTGNIRNNTATVSMYFDESAGFVRQTDDVRIFRDDNARPALDPTTGGSGIEINWRTPVNVVSTGGSALTTEEHNALLALPSASTTASTVLSAASSTPIHADIRKVNGGTVDGDGSDGNPWGPV